MHTHTHTHTHTDKYVNGESQIRYFFLMSVKKRDQRRERDSSALVDRLIKTEREIDMDGMNCIRQTSVGSL